jgi:hypothetical protein
MHVDVEVEGRMPTAVVAISRGGGLLLSVVAQEEEGKARKAVEKAIGSVVWMRRNADGTSRLNRLGNCHRY